MSQTNRRVRLSVVIPAYNERELLPAALAALQEALSEAGWREASELVVCDNASTDETAELARQAGARVVREPRRIIAAVRNSGARAATGDWLIFTDADSRVSPGLLADTLAAFADETVIGGGAHLALDPQECGRRGRRIVAFWNWLSSRRGWAAGGYIFCRASDFMSLGGFDESYYASEELNFSQRIKQLGKQTGRRFVILDQHPLVTSGRKVDYPLSWREKWAMLQFALGRTSIVKDPRNCGFWYHVDR